MGFVALRDDMGTWDVILTYGMRHEGASGGFVVVSASEYERVEKLAGARMPMAI